MFEALVGGVVSGTIVAVVQHYLLWLKQQHFQIKKSVFDDAVSALAMYETDAMNIELQASNVGAGGIRHDTKLREPTNILMTKSLALVPAFFSPEAGYAYSMAFRTTLRPKEAPNSLFYERRDEAVRLLAVELTRPHESIFAPFLRKWRLPRTADRERTKG